MSSFTEFNAPLKVQYDFDYSREKRHDYWDLLDEFTFYTDQLPEEGKLWIKVPKAFKSDGATIPRWLWSLLPPMGQYGQAAVLHDYLRKTYTAYLDEAYGEPINAVELTTKQTDLIFLEAMGVLGVGTFKKYLMYGVVRVYAILKGKG